jgi:DNA-binding MarR family transcriptional regulator
MRHPDIHGQPLSKALKTARTASVLDGYAVEEQVGFLMRRANQRHTAIFLDGMAAAELTPTQFTALIKVVELGRVTQNHLGRLAAMDPATIQGVVRRLLDRDLMTRTDDPLDRRTIVLAPTQAGLALAAQAVVAARRITEATLDPLTPEERRQLLSLLHKLC